MILHILVKEVDTCKKLYFRLLPKRTKIFPKTEWDIILLLWKINNEDQDFFSAIKICKKKRIGPNRDEANRGLFYKKDIGVLARAGFDFEVSRRVMELEKEEYLKIINLL